MAHSATDVGLLPRTLHRLLWSLAEAHLVARGVGRCGVSLETVDLAVAG